MSGQFHRFNKPFVREGLRVWHRKGQAELLRNYPLLARISAKLVNDDSELAIDTYKFID
jgi:hypothetical protein